MCFHVATPKKEDLGKILPEYVTIEDYKPYYHVSGFAHPDLPVLSAWDAHLVQPFKWGLIPFFAKNEQDAKGYMGKTLNARSETVYTTPMFRTYAAGNRCLIFVNGFFEWKHVGKEKLPHFIHMPGNVPFALGGIYSSWENIVTREVHRTCSIITTEANELMATIHNSKKRMPLVLQEDDWGMWLNMDVPKYEIEQMMVPYHDGELIAHPISKLITTRGADTNVPEVQKTTL